MPLDDEKRNECYTFSKAAFQIFILSKCSYTYFHSKVMKNKSERKVFRQAVPTQKQHLFDNRVNKNNDNYNKEKRKINNII